MILLIDNFIWRRLDSSHFIGFIVVRVVISTWLYFAQVWVVLYLEVMRL